MRVMKITVEHTTHWVHPGWTVRVYTDEKELAHLTVSQNSISNHWLWRKLGNGFKQLWEKERKSNDEAWTKEKSDEI